MCERKVFLCLMLYLPLLSAKELSIKDLIRLPFAQVYNMRVKPASKKVKKQPQKNTLKVSQFQKFKK